MQTELNYFILNLHPLIRSKEFKWVVSSGESWVVVQSQYGTSESLPEVPTDRYGGTVTKKSMCGLISDVLVSRLVNTVSRRLGFRVDTYLSEFW